MDLMTRYADEPLDGKYRLLQRLGTGGMGEVYKVEHTYLGITRVIKVIRPQISESADAHERFLREARLATKVQHPNVATLHDFSGLPDGSHYMVWELIDGENLAQLLKRRGSLPAREAVRLTIEAARGLEAIHRAGIVHRDISPENLMLTSDGHIKIIDLGVAKSTELEGATTKTGIFVGKLRYASPEQLGLLEEGERIDGRTDIYSLGVVLYEMLTGRPPFEATSPHQYLLHASQQTAETRVTPQNLPGGEELQAILARALARDRSQRFASAAAFADALEHIRWTDNEPTVRMAAAPTVIEPIAPHAPSSAWRIAVIALVLLAFAAVIAALMWRPKAQPEAAAVVTTTTHVVERQASSPVVVVEQKTPAPPKKKKPEPRQARTPVAPQVVEEAAPAPAPAPSHVATFVENGDGDANDAAIAAARAALAGTTRVAVRGNGDARLTAELARMLAKNLTVDDGADVVITFNGTLDRLGRGRKRRAATASVAKNGRTLFRYELPAQEYRVGDDPAEAFARVLSDVLR
jgi:tRNA A-37 threonylcarbamoyl transferase component Bud32/outer membrane biosynthesis protein TonB